jgi:hypothetical protein
MVINFVCLLLARVFFIEPEFHNWVLCKFQELPKEIQSFLAFNCGEVEIAQHSMGHAIGLLNRYFQLRNSG